MPSRPHLLCECPFISASAAQLQGARTSKGPIRSGRGGHQRLLHAWSTHRGTSASCSRHLPHSALSSTMGWYSLWIEPTGRLAEQLQGEIDSLKATHDGPGFCPHVTLAAFNASDDEAAKSMTEELMPKIKPFFLSFKDVGYGESYHQCVFMLCAKDQQVAEAAAVAKESLGLDNALYVPHLSFLYSDIDEDKRQEVVRHLQQRLYGESQGYDTLLVETGFEAAGVSLWNTPAEDKSLESWTRLADYRFLG